MPTSALSRFLQQAMHVALNPRTNPITFVFGNEGGDIDSVVSAIYTALLLSSSWEVPTHVPIVNFPREDLRLRGDVWTMLSDHGITENCLLFEEHLHGTSPEVASVISTKTDNSAGSDRSLVFPQDTIILTDHNVLRSTQTVWATKVVGIVDHHADEHLYDSTSSTVVKRIEPVGSATSLVALLWKESATQRAIPSPLLLLSPIVADTGNFKTTKNTPSDEAARDYILSNVVQQQGESGVSVGEGSSSVALTKMWAALANGSASTNDLAAHLKALKDDIRALTVAETLRRDYKKFALAGGFNVGISAVLLTKKQCRKLYAEKRKVGDESIPAGAESNDDDDSTDTLEAFGGVEEGGIPTDLNDWLPTIAARMEANYLNVYMNMFNKKGRELEVIYRVADADRFEAVWEGSFLPETKGTIGLRPKRRFVDGKAFAYVSERSLVVNGSPLKQIVYRQENTNVSRKNFTPFLVNIFAKHFAEKPTSDELKSDL